MLFRLALSFFLLVLSFTVNVQAHSVLLESNPSEGEVLTEEVTTITLSFNTKTEKGSEFYVQDDKGAKYQPDITIGSDQRLIGNFDSPLTNGEYTVYWSVIGADGHEIEGEYSFDIQGVEEEDKSNDEISVNEDEPNLQHEEDDSVKRVNDDNSIFQQEDSNIKVQTNNDGVNNSSNLFFWIVVIFAIFALIIWGISMLKKPKEK